MTFRRFLSPDEPPPLTDTCYYAASWAACVTLWPLILALLVLGVLPLKVRVRAKQ